MRTILHVDMNNFYASVECLYHPEIRHLPVAVAGDPANRHGIILAKNMLAKKLGVKTGEAIWQAQLKAPNLVTVPPDFRKYLKFSRLARKILYDYTDQVELSVSTRTGLMSAVLLLSLGMAAVLLIL